ncbi:MAG: condensation domain-containing protein [Candidatus Aminicenantes bacterium]|jgi:amino acid adenylation domain-containing protein
MNKNQNVKDIYSLAPLQEGLLFHWLLDESTSSYFGQMEYTLRGNIDADLLEKSVNKIIERYDILRTVYIYEKVKTPIQVVLKKRTVKIHFEDISYLNGDEQKNEYIKRFRERDREKGCDLSKDVLIRIALFQLGENQARLIWSVHHILMDAWCLEILYRELVNIYTSLKKGEEPQLGPAISYKNYIQWLEQQDKDKGYQYWRQYLLGYDNPAILPQPNNKPVNRQAELIRYFHTIEPSLVDGLLNIVVENNVTVNTIWQTIWGILLQKYNNVEDVVYGIVVSGRNADIEGVEEMIGLFINTIPVRITLEDDSRFLQLLLRVQQREVLSKSYDYFPLAEVQSCSTLKGDLIHHLMAYESRPVLTKKDEKIKNRESRSNLSDFTVIDMEPYHQANYDFGVVIIPNPMQLVLYYNPTAYEIDFIKNITRHVNEIIEQIVKNPAVDVREMEILGKEEKNRLLFDLNKTGAGYPQDKTIHELFEKQVEKTPDNMAAAGEGAIGHLPQQRFIQLTYRELNKKANQLAHLLKRKGVPPHSVIGIMMDHSLEMPVGILGILKAGCAFLPIDPGYPQKRVISMLNDCCAPVLLGKSYVLNDRDFSFSALQGSRLQLPGNEIQVTAVRPQIKDFDSIGIPDRSLVNYEKYSQHIGITMFKNGITLQATRGCPYRCAYCHRIWPKSHVVRSAENLLEEVQALYNMGVRRFSFADDIFNLNVKNSTRFYRLLIKNGIKAQLFFSNGLRGDILTKDYIDLLIEAGTVNIALALETGSPRLQKLLNKNIDIDKLRENTQYICEKYPDIILELQTMHGFPTETPEEAIMTFDFIKNMKWVHFPYIHILKVYPNTDMASLALENGVSPKAIEDSLDLAFHELPGTLPFDKSLTLKIQSEYLNQYILSKERLMKLLPYQFKLMTPDEIIQKYNNFFPIEINNLDDFYSFVGISEDELGIHQYLDEDTFVPDLNHKMHLHFSSVKPNENALKIMLLDLSQYMPSERESHYKSQRGLFYETVEAPLGLMYLLTALKETFGSRINGKIYKSRIDFDSYAQLKTLLEDFKPDVIGIRTLSFYRNFFHTVVSLIRHWGIDVPIVTGGPYATSEYMTVLQDRNIDLVVLGEGEETFTQLVGKIMENSGKLPDEEQLAEIAGIAFVPCKDESRQVQAREIFMLDEIENLLDREPGANPGIPNNSSSSDLAYVVFTSGSTGNAKGVMVEHRSLVNMCYWHNRCYGVMEKDHATKYAGFGFDASIWEVFPYLIKGASLHIIKDEIKLDIEKLKRYYEARDITISFLPTQLGEQFISMEQPNRSLRILLTGGDKLNDFRNQPYDLYNNYGPAENTVVTSFYLVDTYQENIPIGKPVDNCQVYILSHQRAHLMPVGVPGELCIGGDSLARGYLNNIELTKEKFIFVSNLGNGHQIIYHTGDLARWLNDGNIQFLGRVDQQVSIRGSRIEPGEIEFQLKNHPQVKDAVVLAEQAEDGEKEMYAFITCPETLELSELRQFLANRLPDYMIPSYFLQIESIPLNPNGKIDRKVLFKKGKRIRSSGQYLAPQLEIERQIADVWSQLLNVKQEEISVHDNFFELGGDSIKVIQMRSRLKELTEQDIQVSMLFEHPTIHSLGQFLNQGKIDEDGATPAVEEEIDRSDKREQGIKRMRQRMNQGKRN